MKLCDWEEREGRLVCRDCRLSIRLVQPLPVAACGAGEPSLRNDRSVTGPCRFEGAAAEPVPCRTCAGNILIKTFACDCRDVPQLRATWSEKPMPEDVAKCGGCDWYEASVPPEQAVAALQERPPLAPNADSPASEA